MGLCFWPQSVCLCGGRLAEENSRLYSRSVAFSRPQNVLLAEHGGCAPTPGGHKRELGQSQKSERLFLSLKHNTIACLHISSSLILFFIIQNSTFVFRFDFQSFGNAYGRWNGEKMFQWSFYSQCTKVNSLMKIGGAFPWVDYFCFSFHQFLCTSYTWRKDDIGASLYCVLLQCSADFN